MKSANTGPSDGAVMGVDPAVRRSGLALLEFRGAGTVTLVSSCVIRPSGQGRSELLFSLQHEFSEVLTAWRPAAVYLERPGVWRRKGGTRAQVIEGLEAARAVLLAACGQQGVPAFEIGVQEIRRTLLGKGNARREAVLQFVEKLGLDLPRPPGGRLDDDVANAVAVAVYGLNSQGMCINSTRFRWKASPP